ncbi:tetratricopeptide repeat protein [Chitiniphilus eburneus]|nr:tetratricopeptide repeat protein [Chitiniphilus eburneus]
MALATQARKLAQSQDDAQSESQALTVFAHGLFMFGRSLEAQDTLLEALVLGEKRDIGAARGEALQLAGRVAYTLGDYDRAADCWCACIELEDSQINAAERIQAHIGLGQLRYAHQHLELALAHHQRAAQLAENCDNVYLTCTSFINIAADLVQLGRADEAIAILKKTLPLVREDQNYQFEAEIFGMFGLIRMQAGEYEAARMSLMVALKINRLHINTWGEASVLLRLGRCSLESDELDMAVEQFARAQMLAESMSSLPLLSELEQSLAELHLRSGDAEAAAQHQARHESLRQKLFMQTHCPRFANLELRLLE